MRFFAKYFPPAVTGIGQRQRRVIVIDVVAAGTPRSPMFGYCIAGAA